DGYYMLADWLEIPNLREKSNRYLNNLFLDKCLGIEVPPDAYMAPTRKWLFVIYAIASWIYRWVVMFSILWFLADFLGPKLKILSQMLAVASLASLFIWPTYRVVKNINQRGRLPDMKAARVYITFGVLGAVLAAFFLLPLPVSRVGRLAELRAPRDGVVATAPKPDEVGKLFDKGGTETQPLFVVGDPTRLLIRVPINPQKYRVLMDDLPEGSYLEVSVYVK